MEKITQEELDLAIKQHELRLNSDKDVGCLINFENKDLSNLDFSKKDISYAKFLFCILDDAVFDSAIIRRCQFSYSSLKRTKFEKTDLTSCIFANSSLRYANLCNANLENVVFDFVDLLNANLKLTDLTDCKFVNTNLSFAMYDTSYIASRKFNKFFFIKDINYIYSKQSFCGITIYLSMDKLIYVEMNDNIYTLTEFENYIKENGLDIGITIENNSIIYDATSHYEKIGGCLYGALQAM